MPARRRSAGPCDEISPPARVMTPDSLPSHSPVSAAINSSWPLPAIPAIPKISPARASIVISRSVTENAFFFGRFNLLTESNISLLAGAFCRATSLTLVPIINSASWRFDWPLVFTEPTFCPRRNTVARLVKARISSSLCEINNTASPFLANRRSTSKSCSVSCGVNTDVGSSMISNFGSCSKQRTISTRCCWPTDRL